ncbi:two-component system sensor histidine kinase CreC [bacterium]|nr:two-component system sensor histidine kinase CreC [bacterium]
MSLRTKLILVLTLVIFVGFGSVFKWTVDELRPRYLEAVEETLVDEAYLMAAMLAPSFESNSFNPTIIDKLLKDTYTRSLNAKIYHFLKTKIETRVYITDSQGIVLYDSTGLDTGAHYSNWQNIARTLKGQYGARASHEEKFSGQNSVMHVSAPVIKDGNLVGTLTLAKPTNVVNWFIESVKPQMLLSFTLAGSAILLLAILMSLWITAPVKALTRYAAQVRDGHNPALPALGKNEMGELGKTFYEMKQTLEGKQYIENYIQNLTHELRTPLTAIMAAAEILGDHPDETDKQKFLGHIQQNTARMKSLIDQMLKLAELENRKIIESEKINLESLIEKVLNELEVIYTAKNITVSFPRRRESILNDGLGFFIKGDSLLIEQAFKNVLDNAFDFTPQNGSIVIKLNRENADTKLSVHDSGPGFPAYALPKVFDRFFSLPRPQTGQKSTGLGLNFTKQIMEMHGGSLSVSNTPSGALVSLLFHTH